MPTKTLMMKDSNIDWMGDIPNTWQVKRLKYVMDNYDYLRQPIDASQRTQDGDILYDYYGASGVIDKIDDYICEGEKILIGEDGANLKMRTLPLIYIASGKYWVNNHAHILYPKNDNNLHFFAHQMESIDYENFITGSAQPKLSQENLNNVLLIEPPAYEQKAIAVFLDEKCEKIDKVIGEIEEQIQVLEDYKKSLITETVTKGIDKNVPMKDSGIDWIGKIPANWDIKKLKYCCRICNGAEYADIEVSDGGYPVMGSGGEFARASKYSYDKESVLLGRKGTIDKPLYVDFPFWAVDTMFYTKINKNMYPKFLYYSATKIRFDYYVTATALPSMTQRDLGSEPLTIPPYNIQMQIADYLDKECAKIDTTINDKKEQLETIKEYKKSLIYEYVTGKKRIAY